MEVGSDERESTKYSFYFYKFASGTPRWLISRTENPIHVLWNKKTQRESFTTETSVGEVVLMLVDWTTLHQPLS
jgi:hypothetical protein